MLTDVCDDGPLATRREIGFRRRHTRPGPSALLGLGIPSLHCSSAIHGINNFLSPSPSPEDCQARQAVSLSDVRSHTCDDDGREPSRHLGRASGDPRRARDLR